MISLRRLFSLSFWTAASIVAVPVSASTVYTLVVPGVATIGSPQPAPDFAFKHAIDINADGRTDIFFGWIQQTYMGLYSGPDVQILTLDPRRQDGGLVVPAPAGQLIGATGFNPALRWFEGIIEPLPTEPAYPWRHFLASGEGGGPVGRGFYGSGGHIDGWEYVLYRIQEPDGWHYGYLHILYGYPAEYVPNPPSFTRVGGVLVAYAYNDVAGDPILTGVPEPGTAGLLLLSLLTGSSRRRPRCGGGAHFFLKL